MYSRVAFFFKKRGWLLYHSLYTAMHLDQLSIVYPFNTKAVQKWKKVQSPPWRIGFRTLVIWNVCSLHFATPFVSVAWGEVKGMHMQSSHKTGRSRYGRDTILINTPSPDFGSGGRRTASQVDWHWNQICCLRWRNSTCSSRQISGHSVWSYTDGFVG